MKIEFGRDTLLGDKGPTPTETEAFATAPTVIVPSFLLYLEKGALKGNKILVPASFRRNIHTYMHTSSSPRQCDPFIFPMGGLPRWQKVRFSTTTKQNVYVRV